MSTKDKMLKKLIEIANKQQDLFINNMPLVYNSFPKLNKYQIECLIQSLNDDGLISASARFGGYGSIELLPSGVNYFSKKRSDLKSRIIDRIIFAIIGYITNECLRQIPQIVQYVQHTILKHL